MSLVLIPTLIKKDFETKHQSLHVKNLILILIYQSAVSGLAVIFWSRGRARPTSPIIGKNEMMIIV